MSSKTAVRARDEGQVRRQHARLRLVDVARREELRPLRADVGDFEHAAAAELPLHVHVPVLHVGRAQVALDGERRVGQREGEDRRERIVDRQRQPELRQREEEVEVEVRRVEVERLAGRERRLVVVDAVARAQDGLARRRPASTRARRAARSCSGRARSRCAGRRSSRRRRACASPGRRCSRGLRRPPAASCTRSAVRPTESGAASGGSCR